MSAAWTTTDFRQQRKARSSGRNGIDPTANLMPHPWTKAAQTNWPQPLSALPRLSNIDQIRLKDHRFAPTERFDWGLKLSPAVIYTLLREWPFTFQQTLPTWPALQTNWKPWKPFTVNQEKFPSPLVGIWSQQTSNSRLLLLCAENRSPQHATFSQTSVSDSVIVLNWPVIMMGCYRGQFDKLDMEYAYIYARLSINWGQCPLWQYKD